MKYYSIILFRDQSSIPQLHVWNLTVAIYLNFKIDIKYGIVIWSSIIFENFMTPFF